MKIKICFLHNTQGPGKFPDRWNKALTRLQETDIEILVETIRLEIEKVRCAPKT
jgi:hypothetical protein